MTGPTPTQTRTERDPDLIIARAHLRLGSLALARAELETLAGRDRLDDEGVRDLAEARWRTGDTTGAGEAASTYLEVAPDDVVALVIAAEAQADLGRPAEARRLAGRAMERADGSLDPVFAGMHRSAIWPVDPGTAVGPVGVLFDDLHPGPISADPTHARRATDRGASAAEAAPHAPLDPAIPAAIHGGPGLWDDEVSAAKVVAPVPVDGATLFHRAQIALDQGQPATAATGLILALRSAPELAPAVLDLLSGRAEPILVLVRGDAQQIVGREVEAMRDHALVASRIAELLPPESPADMAHPVVESESESESASESKSESEPESQPEATEGAEDSELATPDPEATADPGDPETSPPVQEDS